MALVVYVLLVVFSMVAARPFMQPPNLYAQQRPRILLTEAEDSKPVDTPEVAFLKGRIVELEKRNSELNINFEAILENAKNHREELKGKDKEHKEELKKKDAELKKAYERIEHITKLKDLATEELSIVSTLTTIDEMEKIFDKGYHQVEPIEEKRTRAGRWRYIFKSHREEPCVKVMLDAIYSLYNGTTSSDKEEAFIKICLNANYILTREKHHWIWARYRHIPIQFRGSLPKEYKDIISIFEKASIKLAIEGGPIY